MKDLKMSLSQKSFVLILSGMSLALPQSIFAQNHNPEFKVSNTFLGGEPYIFIGDDDEAVYPHRTPVELKYREEAPEGGRTGKTTLVWISGGDLVDSYDSENDTSGVVAGSASNNGNASTSGSWSWSDAEQQNFDGMTIYLQGKTAAAAENAADTATLKASHDEDPEEDAFEKEFTFIRVDLDVTKPNGAEVDDVDEQAPGMVIAPPEEDGNLRTELIAKATDSNVGGTYRMRFSQELPIYSDASGNTPIPLTANGSGYVTPNFSATSDTTYYTAPPEDASGSTTVELDWWMDGADLQNDPPTSEGADVVTLLKVELDPITDLKADDIDPNGALNQIRNPAGIVIESDPNDSNVAIFEITTSLYDDDANELIHWEIEPNGGNASFYPSDDQNNNKGKVVKITGDSGGRGPVKINVYVGEPDEDSQPVVFAEAEVVEPKVLRYRANIINNLDADRYLPDAVSDLPSAFSVANIILRQAGVELVPSTDTSTGYIDDTITALIEPVQNSPVFKCRAHEDQHTVDVPSTRDYLTLSINYRENVFQISFVESVFNEIREETIAGRNKYRLESTNSDGYIESAYVTSLNDIFDETLAHRLDIDSASTIPDTFPNLHGVLVSWFDIDNINGAGQTIAHEVAHGLNVLHRAGNTYDHKDGLETQLDGALLGDPGTNNMDYPADGLGPNRSGVDLDFLQVKIIQASPALE